MMQTHSEVAPHTTQTWRGIKESFPALDLHHIVAKLVPFCGGKRGLEVNLDELMVEACKQDPDFSARNPIERANCIEQFHKLQNIDFSFGGFLENRSHMFAETYMAKDRRFIHLGVDINVPAGTEVHFPASMKVLNIWRDFDTEVGWGTRIDLADPTLPLVVLLGHLAPETNVTVGETLPNDGKKIGAIGATDVNGGCDPHLHIQVMSRERYDQLVGKDLDGYGKVTDLVDIRSHYLDPLSSLSRLVGEQKDRINHWV